jgi:DNA-binding transcriptional LysR family regulator
MHDPANQRWRRASTATLDQRLSRMELRRLHYLVTLAEELHFGRAAAREHIVQSALSQRLQRLERELGVTLVERTTHQVRLTAAGAAFLVDAGQILAHVERATVERPSLRVGVVDASYDSMSLVLHEAQQQYSDLGIHVPLGGVPPDPVPGVPATACRPRPTWSHSSAVCCVHRPRACRPDRDRVEALGGPPFALQGRRCVGPAAPQTMSAPLSTPPARCRSSSAGCSLGGGLIPILRVLSASVMSRALIRPFPLPPGAVS